MERKKLMSIAGIEKVKKAELDADKYRKDADDKAAAIVADGRKEAQRLLDQAEKDADQQYKEVLAKAEEEAAKLYQDKIDEEQRSCEKLKADGREYIGQAVDTIVGKVVKANGNS